MYRRLRTYLIALHLLHIPALHAQSEFGALGWLGLVRTPAGGFSPAPLLFPASDSGRAEFTARFSRWSFGPGDDETTNFGFSIESRRGSRTNGWVIARSINAQCSDCSVMMFAAESHRPLESFSSSADTSGLGVNVGISSSFGAYGGDGFGATLALKAPIAVTRALGPAWRVSPFIVPGVGGALLPGAVGATALFGYGVSLTHATRHLGATVGVQTALIEDAPSVTGIALRWRF